MVDVCVAWAGSGRKCRGGHFGRVGSLIIVGLYVFGGSAALAKADPLARGRELYVLCSSCHGERGQGDQRRGAPVIGGMPEWYVAAQLRKFLAGERGYHPDDTTGLQMRPMAQAVYRDGDLQAVAAYVASLHPPTPARSHDAGDPARGQTLYATCAACHGVDGKGNEALKAPRLAGQAGWYLAEQLKKFRSGQRGAAAGDATGAQMRAMVNVLPDDQAIADVVAYISTLKP
ncbi:MAG: paerucumarin biosynthesis protein PvcD [Candidatus Binatia bacterium]|nr:MAG: paerucumarin biosynthesis protein PvcD [Candidatus Binatia bacterium]